MHPKVKASGIAGAVSILLIAALEGLGVDVSPEVAGAITTVCATAAGWLRVA